MKPDFPTEPLRFDVFAADCPSRTTLAHITGRWGSLTLAALGVEPQRFGTIRNKIGGISEKMLAQTLHALEAEGLVYRRVHDGATLNVDYRLTDAGVKLATKVRELIETIYETLPETIPVSAPQSGTGRPPHILDG